MSTTAAFVMTVKLKSDLNQVVKHKLGNTSSSPFRVCEYVRNVGLVVRDVGYHKGETDDNMAVEDHATEIRILQTFSD